MTPQEAAKHFGVAWRTVRRWIKEGRPPFDQVIQPGGPRGRQFIRRDAIEGRKETT